jgi:hypothetical protein
MSDLDCYFTIDPDPSISDDARTMLVWCQECRMQHFPDMGWFYQGSKDGYGDFDFTCDICGKIIHRHIESEELEELE